jgi:hypothetical protein
MNKTIGLAMIGASILAFATPAFAQTVKNDRMTSHAVMSGGERSAPVSLRERGPEMPVYGWNTDAGFDRASSPYQGGGY